MIVALLVVTLGSVAVGAAGVAGYKVNKRKSFKRRYRNYRRAQAKRARENAQWQKDRVVIARDIAEARIESRKAKAERRTEAKERRDERREARRRAAEARAQATQQAPPATSTPPPAKKTTPAKTTQRRPATPTTQTAAGQCGAPTADGTACDRAATKPGMCGIDSHRPGPWAAGKKKATATP